MDYLKREGCDPYRRDDKGDLPIHAYVRRTDPQRLGCLFAFLIYSDDYDIDAINKEADTPLHLACMVRKEPCWWWWRNKRRHGFAEGVGYVEALDVEVDELPKGRLLPPEKQ